MKKADSLIPSITRQTAGESRPAHKAAAAPAGHDHVDVINQVFAELELAYHNQYHKAYGQEGSVGVAKRYWLECLSPFSPEIILTAVRQVVKTREFLPSIASVVQACEEALTHYGLPSSHDAYVEACNPPNPKAEFPWTHPAVYLAGKQTGWFDLANKTENQVFPYFEQHYRALCQRALNGEELTFEIPQALASDASKVLSSEENKKRMAALRKTLEK